MIDEKNDKQQALQLMTTEDKRKSVKQLGI